MTITDLDGCDGIGGPLARAATQDDSTSGYAGAVCRDSWSIVAAEQDSSDVDEIESDNLGDTEIDDQPHTYRLEVSGETIRLFLDGQFVGEAADNRFQDSGLAGIFLNDEINVEVSEFRVFTITAEQ